MEFLETPRFGLLRRAVEQEQRKGGNAIPRRFRWRPMATGIDAGLNAEWRIEAAAYARILALMCNGQSRQEGLQRVLSLVTKIAIDSEDMLINANGHHLL